MPAGLKRFVEGQVGDSVYFNPHCVGWLGQTAHPNSPSGGGGPGHFVQTHPVAADHSTTPDITDSTPLQSSSVEGLQLKGLWITFGEK